MAGKLEYLNIHHFDIFPKRNRLEIWIVVDTPHSKASASPCPFDLVDRLDGNAHHTFLVFTLMLVSRYL
jgi:hypothetical protein